MTLRQSGGKTWLLETSQSLLAAAMTELGVAPERVREWADLLETDAALAEGFDPGLRLEQTHSLFRGDAVSRWVLNLPPGDESLTEAEYRSELTLCETCPIRTWSYVSARYFTDLVGLASALAENPGQDARKLAYDLRWKSALEQGRRTAERTGEHDLTGLDRHYWSRFPNIRVVEHTRTAEGERMVCRADSCNFCQGFQMQGLDPGRLAEVGKLACIPDEAFIYGLIPNVRFEMPANQMQGDSHCTWVLEVPAVKRDSDSEE